MEALERAINEWWRSLHPRDQEPQLRSLSHACHVRSAFL